MNCAIHSDTPAAAYCRTCGKALCENCKRDVQGAIYCEPCIAVRLQGSRVAAPAQATTPSPGVALLLGFIPGVGAMYNGQFIKGFVHVMIFVMLMIAGDKISDYFALAVFIFYVYMIFDAYKTAQAKLLGLPLPDPLGIDKMFGLQESQPPVSTSTTATAATPATAPAQTATVAPPPAHAPAGNEPVGAIVLIVLGVALLLGTIGHLQVGKLWPLFLIGIGLWIAYKRLSAGSGEPR
jgi:TM2 domain-containing membrane protein YozV